MEYLWIVWLSVTVLAVIVESATLSLVSVWFIPGALISLVLSLCNVNVIVQVVVFAVLSLGSLLFVRPLTKKLLKIKNIPTNADSLVGEKGVVIEKIDNIGAKGAVKIRGQIWTARSVSDSLALDEGDIVTVRSIEGVKLICEK